MKKTFFIVMLMACLPAFLNAQGRTITGTVINNTSKEPLAGVTVKIKGTGEGISTDEKGKFNLSTNQAFPLKLEVSSVGFEKAEFLVSSTGSPLDLALLPVVYQETEVVLAPTRAPISARKSPVTIESATRKQIINSPSGYYDIPASAKGVGYTTSSLLFKTISTRGFNGSGSTRVNQLVDGMDNQAPGLNFFVGNFVGLTELDVDNMELLPGASSALYGPGGMNGTILIHSKSPFKDPGLSIQVKQGIMHVDKRQRENASSFMDYSFRWAKNFKDKFAFKLGAQLINAKDWLADDTSNYLRLGSTGKLIPGSRLSDPNYDGVNVYGDETSRDLRNLNVGNGQTIDLWYMVGQAIKQQVPQLGPGIDAAIALTPAMLAVSRTGYHEKEVIDPVTKNIKLSGAVHYKFSDKLEGQLMGYWATGNTVFTGNNRFAFKNIKIGQYKAELKHTNWFLRSYTTQEDAGEAYSATVATQYFNEAWKPSGTWFQEYTQGYLVPAATLWLQTYGAAQAGGQSHGESVAAANAALSARAMDFHNSGRSTADQGRPLAGSAQFRRMYDSVRMVPIPNGGLFLEKSQLWMTEGQYNFSNTIKFAEVIVGANLKKYILDSKGTLFIDTSKAITINEMGAYAQVTKKLFKEILTLSVSGRYDKNEDFKGHFTPRASALINAGKENYFRLSYQTAYRFPSTQQKYIRLDVGEYTLLGGLPWVTEFMNAKNNPVVELINGVPSSTPYEYKELKPERSSSFEVGYKSLIAKRLSVDAYIYWGKYEDFLGRNILFQPGTGKVFSTVLNSNTNVNTNGFGIGMDYRFPGNYSLFTNVSSDEISNVPPGFQSYFNTPKYRVNAGITNSGLGRMKRIGFNVTMRWQDAFNWDGELANGPMNANTTRDAQVN